MSQETFCALYTMAVYPLFMVSKAYNYAEWFLLGHMKLRILHRVCVRVCDVHDTSAETQDNNICPLIAAKAIYNEESIGLLGSQHDYSRER